MTETCYFAKVVTIRNKDPPDQVSDDDVHWQSCTCATLFLRSSILAEERYTRLGPFYSVLRSTILRATLGIPGRALQLD